MSSPGKLIRNAAIYAFPIIAFILSLFAKETSQAARNALYLSLDVVIPSLFPYFVLSRLTVPFLSGFRCPRFLKKLIERFFKLPYYTIVIIILGYLSGYPTGAKLTADMLDEGLIDAQQASRLIAVANNCSPLFVIGTIGAGLFGSIKIGFLLLIIHWLSGIIAAFLTGRFVNYTSSKQEPSEFPYRTGICSNEKPHIISLLPSAVEDAAILSIKVTGYIVLFAVLSELLSRLGVFAIFGSLAGMITGSLAQRNHDGFISAFLKGVLEITSGSQAISQLTNYPMNVKLSMISLICGFAGFSVHSQIMGIMKGSGAKYRVLIAGKTLHGLIACLLTFIVTSLSPMTLQASNVAGLSIPDFSWLRIIIIGVLIISLLIAPYESESRKNYRKVCKR